ncbi:hypothetical protein F0562_008403 [Nyssa sinensis]|uniref:Uncharacterized protein n=1 Tax=Nyssa sinensis TaxID=561372 RepID=A0A5J5A836_9ASTE|nr:hypothetical protein F0562_008403 [Nyssa sinensis]
MEMAMEDSRSHAVLSRVHEVLAVDLIARWFPKNSIQSNLHNERHAAAKATLLKPNPWLFNDGVLFFHDLSDQDKHLPVSNANPIGLVDTQNEGDNDLAIVINGENATQTSNGHDEIGCTNNLNSTMVDTDCDSRSRDKNLNSNEGYSDLVIPGVLRKDEISNLEVRFMGVGKIAARLCERDEVSNGISRIWCEWLGKKDSGDEDMVQEHDFAVVTFAYNFDLGRKGLLEDVRYLLSSSPWSEIEDAEGARKKGKKSFSDP